MKHSLAALCALTAMAGCSYETEFSSKKLYGPEVVGGVKADYSQFPSIVVIADADDNGEHCSATLIKPDLVLTAAHCIVNDPIEDFYGVYGTSDLYSGEGQLLEFKRSMAHQDYATSGKDRNDIGLILLKEKISDAVTVPILLPEAYDTFISKDDIVTLTGYGENSNLIYGELYSVELPVIERDGLEMVLGDMYGASGACYGDSGGPSYVTTKGGVQKVTGITVRLPPYAQQCGQGTLVTLPGSYMPWIEESYEKLLNDDPFQNAGITVGPEADNKGMAAKVEPYGCSISRKISGNYHGSQSSLITAVVALYALRRRKENAPKRS